MKSPRFSNKDLQYYLVYFVICGIYSIFFSPVIYTDSPRYIFFAKEVLGEISGSDLRGILSPLYAYYLVPFIKIWGIENFARPVIISQYILIFISSIIIYRIFLRLTSNKKQAFFIGLISILLPSTINYGYLILSEILTYFLFLLMLLLLLNARERYSINSLIIAGFVSALMIFARFNMIFIPIISAAYLFFITLNKNEKHFNAFRAFKVVFIYLVPIIFLLNVWSYRNLELHGFYFPFARMNSTVHISGSLMLLTENTPVRKEDKKVKQILLDAKKELLNKDRKPPKGSLLGMVDLDYYYDMTIGSKIFGNTMDTLCFYYGLNDKPYQKFALLFEELKPIHISIIKAHPLELFYLRLFSMASTFKMAYTNLPAEFNKTLNTLPSILTKFIKITYILIYPLLFIFFLIIMLKKKYINLNLNEVYDRIFILLLVLYFPVIMFVTADPENSARFKYPSEILVIGLLFLTYNLLFGKKSPSRK